MKLKRELLAFGLVGVVGFVVDVGVLYALAPLFGWYGGRVVSFVAAASATWILNRRYTFKVQPGVRSIWVEYLTYLATMLGGAAVNYGIYALTLRWLHVPGAAALGVAFGSLAGLAANFLSARYLVFKNRA